MQHGTANVQWLQHHPGLLKRKRGWLLSGARMVNNPPPSLIPNPPPLSYGSKHLAARMSSTPFPRSTSSTSRLDSLDALVLLDLWGEKDPLFRNFFPETSDLFKELASIEKRLKTVDGLMKCVFLYFQCFTLFERACQANGSGLWPRRSRANRTNGTRQRLRDQLRLVKVKKETKRAKQRSSPRTYLLHWTREQKRLRLG